MSAEFKVGDIVRRRPGTECASYAVGSSEFVIEKLMGSFAVDVIGQQHDPRNLELVEPATQTAPPVDEYKHPGHEALIRTNEDLQATLRRRNEQIAEQAKQIVELRRAVTQTEARVLDVLPESSYLAVAATQAGLEGADAVKALELGARFLALGYDTSDFDYWRNLDLSFRRRFSSEQVAA